jgi:hypothetical protein
VVTAHDVDWSMVIGLPLPSRKLRSTVPGEEALIQALTT